MSKQFGLIIPGQQKKPAAQPTRAPTRPSIFDESSNSSAESEDAPQKKPSGKPGVVSGPSLMERRKARHMQEKALAEDPTIFQYDELYDDMDNKREEAKETKKQEPRKAKYISRLMEHAERRKLENELRIERQVQKDREAEGEMYKDKDTYVTAAYRKKLESIRQLQEQDERDEYLEAIGDVTKQKDLDGFYRHLYEQKLGTQQPVLKPKTAPSTDDVAYKPIKCDQTKSTKQRTYRRRRSSEDEEQADKTEATPAAEESKSTKAHLPNNIDADSDFSIDDSSDEDEEEKEKEEKQGKPKTKSVATNPDDKLTEKTPSELKDVPPKPTESESKQKPTEEADNKSDNDSSFEKELMAPTVIKPVIDRSLIWRKRTIGDVFDAALSRYHERKLSRRA